MASKYSKEGIPFLPLEVAEHSVEDNRYSEHCVFTFKAIQAQPSVPKLYKTWKEWLRFPEQAICFEERDIIHVCLFYKRALSREKKSTLMQGLIKSNLS